MKTKIFSLLMGLLVVMASFGQSGTTGSLTWSFDGETLTISGKGEMPNYQDAMAAPYYPPWSEISDINIKNVVIKEGVKSIGNNAFSECGSLASISIPESVTSIGSGAFSNCGSLALISISQSVTNIGDGAFYGTGWYNNQPDGIIYINKILYKYKGIMPSNTTINIFEGTTSISGSAFYECSGLIAITIPNSVTSIGGGAFCKCSGLIAITIPSSVTSIGGGIFTGCSGLNSVTIQASVTNIGGNDFSGCNALTELTLPFVESLFNLPSSLKKITINGYNCNNHTSITIPEGITHIGDSAFFNCGNLTSITIPSSLVYIGDGAFDGCYTLSELTFPFIGTTNTEALINLFKNKIPLPFIKVTISNYYCSGLTSIIIPKGVTSIGDGAFYGCSSLTSVTIPESMTSIGILAFMDCSNLTELNFNAEYCSDVDPFAFLWVNLTTVNIGSHVKHIPGNIFRYCNGLTSVTLPDSLESIGDHAFEGCENLQSIVIPDNVFYVGNNAFSDCHNLTYASVGNNVSDIGNYAFAQCWKLATVSLGKSLETIGKQAFAGCPKLRNIYCYGETPAKCASDAFGEDEHDQIMTYAMAKLYYPVDAEEAKLYTLLPVWREFGKYSPFDAAGKEVTVVPSTNTAQVSWNPNADATAYELVIYSDAGRTTIVCILTFDADGRFTGFKLRAGTDDTPFTHPVENLKSGAYYYYTMTAYNNDNEIVEQKLGFFKTEGTSGVPATLASQTNVYGANGNVVVENGSGIISVYDTAGRLTACKKATGGTVRIAVPQAGVYVVQTGKERKKVIVW